jgi:hypothetical protein
MDEKVGELKQRPGGTPLMWQIQNTAFEMTMYELTTHEGGEMGISVLLHFNMPTTKKNYF